MEYAKSFFSLICNPDKWYFQRTNRSTRRSTFLSSWLPWCISTVTDMLPLNKSACNDSGSKPGQWNHFQMVSAGHEHYQRSPPLSSGHHHPLVAFCLYSRNHLNCPKYPKAKSFSCENTVAQMIVPFIMRCLIQAGAIDDPGAYWNPFMLKINRIATPVIFMIVATPPRCKLHSGA